MFIGYLVLEKWFYIETLLQWKVSIVGVCKNLKRSLQRHKNKDHMITA